jgi:hypothetical protein
MHYEREKCPVCKQEYASNWIIRHMKKEHPLVEKPEIRKTEHLAGATLSFRADEIRTYYYVEPKDSPNLYAVTFLSAPTWPEGTVSSRCKSLAIGCIQFAHWKDEANPSWGWVHLDPDAKAIIGEDLESFEFGPDQWIYMVIENDEQDNPPVGPSLGKDGRPEG